MTPQLMSNVSITRNAAEVNLDADLAIYSGRQTARAPKQQGLRFILVGATTAFLDYSTLYLLTVRLGWGYLLSAAVGFMLGSTCNYVISVNGVFVPGKFRRKIEFSFFIITSFVGLMLNQLVMWLLVEIQGINYLYAKAFAVAIVTLWNFSMKKRFVFFE